MVIADKFDSGVFIDAAQAYLRLLKNALYLFTSDYQGRQVNYVKAGGM
jgi:hypothetical protein